jgi:hypothetical protein
LPWILGLSIAVLPWLSPRVRRPAGFVLILGGAAWIFMAMTRDAGASVHHVILLWPLPHVIVGVAAAEISRMNTLARRVILAGLTVAVCVNLLVVNQYLAQMIRVGTLGAWSSATHQLTDTLRARGAAGPILVTDWGIDMPVRVSLRGALRIISLDPPYRIEHDHQTAYYQGILGTPGLSWVTHTDAEQIMAGRNAAIEDLARQVGFSVRTVRTITDSHGRSMYEIRAFSRAQAP